MRRAILLVLGCLMLVGFAGQNLVGTAAPSWNNRVWVNSPPLILSQLKGKVILLRFFMDSTCPLCRASAPYLNKFHALYKDKGLVVIGMYTPKPEPADVSLNQVSAYVKDYHFDFPVALDNDWATLKAYWLDRVPDADYTSVSFLIDKNGTIRYIHQGGAYSAEDAAVIEKQIQALTTTDKHR